MQLDKTIFRMYDVRGEVDKNFSPEVVNLIGKAYAIYIKDKLKKDNITVSIGRDIRLHSKRLANALIDGLVTLGINVIDLGICPTPALYFSLFTLPVDGGIMITGSHNPPEFNGMKICIGRETIYGEEIQALYKVAKTLSYAKNNKKGTLKNLNVLESYEEYLLKEFSSTIPKDIKLKIVIDSGNGCAGLIVPNLLKKLGVNVIDLYSKPDGHFPNHHPDPTIIQTLNTLRETVKKENADFGVAYDGDVDRIGVVDESSNVVYGDKLTYVFAKDIIKRNPGAKIIGEVKCSKTLFEGVKNLGGIPIMSPVGHSLIKKKLRDENALLAGEMSGHIFFNDRYFGYDDAIYATLRLIETVAKEKTTNKRFKFSDLLRDLPQTFTSPEIRINVNEKDKLKIIDSFLPKFKSSYPNLAKKIENIITIDGLRIEFPDGWGLIRASNTQPALVMRFEAETKESLEEYKDAFEKTTSESS
jgi:phosphomannomutase/phosphoglucomutase